MEIMYLKKRKKIAAALLIICLLTTGCGLFNSEEKKENAYCCFEGCHNRVYREGMCPEHYLQVLEARNEEERLRLADEGKIPLTATPSPTGIIRYRLPSIVSMRIDGTCSGSTVIFAEAE